MQMINALVKTHAGTWCLMY